MNKKVKVLCLHGYRQDANKFRQQTGSLRKILKNVVEMEFVSAPHSIPGGEEASRSWWFTQKDSFSSRDASNTSDGLEETITLLENTWQDKGPFDGLLGFSQGACLVTLISALSEKGQSTIKTRFVVLFAGFKSRCKAHETMYPSLINIPSLHVFGESDEVIPCEWGEELVKLFSNGVVIRHPGGHFVPGSSSLKQDYLAFFNRQMLL